MKPFPAFRRRPPLPTSGRPVRRAAWLALPLLLGLALPAPQPVAAAEAGVDLKAIVVERSGHPDVPDSRESTVERRRLLLHWLPDLGEGHDLELVGEREDYRLSSADDEALLRLQLDKLDARYRYAAERWGLRASLLVLDVQRRPAVYRPAPVDDTDRYYLPALVADLTPRPLLLRLGAWDEYDLVTLDGNAYTLIVSRNTRAGVGYAFAPERTLRLDVTRVERVYPQRFDLAETDVQMELRWSDPLDAGDDGAWRDVLATVSRNHYAATGESFHEAKVQAVLRYGGGGGATHYFTPSLTLADSYVVYRRGSRPESLLEQTVSDPDAVAALAYDGFRRLGGSDWFLVWGALWEQSVVRNVQTTLQGTLRLNYTY